MLGRGIRGRLAGYGYVHLGTGVPDLHRDRPGCGSATCVDRLYGTASVERGNHKNPSKSS